MERDTHKLLITAELADPNFAGFSATFSLSFLASVDDWTRSSYFFFQSFTWRSSSCLSQRHEAGSLSFNADGWTGDDFDAVSFYLAQTKCELKLKLYLAFIYLIWIRTRKVDLYGFIYGSLICANYYSELSSHSF